MLTFEFDVHIERGGHGARRDLAEGPKPPAAPAKLPRVARYMALALHFEGLVRDGVVKDYAELAWLGRVTRARMSQVMSLLNLAPEIQEALLYLPRVVSGRDPLVLRDLLPLAAEPDWRKQRRLWAAALEGPGFQLKRARRAFSRPVSSLLS
jgi:hypothetical protein